MYLPASTITIPAIVSGFLDFGDDPEDGSPRKELQNWSSLIGITTAIVGNVLIALALNVQRYAHIRLHKRRREVRERARQALKGAAHGGGMYGGTASNGSSGSLGSLGTLGTPREDGADGLDARESDPLARSVQSVDSRWSSGSEGDEAKPVTSSYLKDPYWWLGQVLITVGECGNFLAYGFAPASIVSPLGVVALISNCVIAPIIFKEVFRTRDFWGVLIAIGGAVTVVLSANTKETRLEPEDVWKAITTIEFEIYMAISCTLIVVLMWASPRYGNRTILIDLGLVGVLGGYTALSTKGVSSMLSSTLLGAFTTPVTYGLLLVLLTTAVMQVRYLNRSLARFDSTQVIPIQFVLFTLSVIIGSAVLYRDFERTTARQAAKFIGGCLLTFFGVFLITSGRPRQDDDDDEDEDQDEDTLSDATGVDETIGLAEQEHHATLIPPSSRRGSESARTQARRSSKTSKVNFADILSKPLPLLAETGIPTLRIPPPSGNIASPGADDNDNDNTPLLQNPWDEDAGADHLRSPQRQRLPAPAVSSDTIPTIYSNAISDTSTAHPAIDFRPETPRPPTASARPQSHSHAFHMISPSPFSSTVSAVVADKLLAPDSPTRNVRSRRSRPGLRNSLFVPQGEIEAEDEEEGLLGGGAAAEGREGGDGAADEHGGFKGRARSLSNTLGGLLGVGRRKRRGTVGDGGEQEHEDGDEPFLARSQTHTGSGLGSGETL